MAKVFISYRRRTAAGEARALYNDLVARLGEDAVFMDVDSMMPGVDFREALNTTLTGCDLMLAVIDKDWTTVKDEKGRTSLDNPDDYVRREIEAALKRDILITPVLVAGARMPNVEELPAEISNLAYRNGFEISHSRWPSDIGEMCRRLKLEAPGHADTFGPRYVRIFGQYKSRPEDIALVAAIIVFLTGLGLYLWLPKPAPLFVSAPTAVPNPAWSPQTVILTAKVSGGVGPYRCALVFIPALTFEVPASVTPPSCEVSESGRIIIELRIPKGAEGYILFGVEAKDAQGSLAESMQEKVTVKIP